MEYFKQCISDGALKCGYAKLRDNQLDVLLSILNQEDVLFISPTSSGKSTTFEVVSFAIEHKVEHTPIALIVSPLVSLTKAQTHDLNNSAYHISHICNMFNYSKSVSCRLCYLVTAG